MSITTTGPDNNNEFTISISGDFDFNLVKAFCTAYKSLTASQHTIVVDFRKTDFMDSSGLGMLIKLRKHLGPNADIRLRTPNAQVLNILEIARFSERFTIE
jgi:anti-anti-sigma factor